jgi:hypothetical protein
VRNTIGHHMPVAASDIFWGVFAFVERASPWGPLPIHEVGAPDCLQ